MFKGFKYFRRLQTAASSGLTSKRFMFAAASMGASFMFAKYQMQQSSFAQMLGKKKSYEPIKIASNHGDFIMFSGNSNKELAAEVAEYLHVPLGKISIQQFNDGEANI